MVKLVGRHHVRAMRAFVRRKLALQERQLAREKEAALPLRELPEYDPDDNGRFVGYDAIFKCEGKHYEALCRVLKKILRPAHYRTWAAANGELVNSPVPCLSAKEIAERVGRHRRTIEIDLQEMREARLLHMQPAQREGRWVMEMHYDVLYRLVHEYLEWERSTDYIPPERQYFERIEIDPDLRQRLLQFEDYRKVLVKKKPGPKGKSSYQETYPVRPTCPDYNRQHTYSDAPILPAASQGGMKRSVNLEPSAPPVSPQAGVSGSIPPMAPVEQYDPETLVSGRCQQEYSPMQNTDENEPQEDADPEATAQTDASDDEDLIEFAEVWTPELQYFLRHERPGLAYFVPLTDFPPEEQNKIPEGAVGLWIWKDPETWQTQFDSCFEWYLEGIDAQPEFDALTQANARYRNAMMRNSLPSADATYEEEQQEAPLENDPARRYDTAHTFPVSQARQAVSEEVDESVVFSNAAGDGTPVLRGEDVTYDASTVPGREHTVANNLRMLHKGDVSDNNDVDEVARQEAIYERETEKLHIVAPSSAAGQDRHRRVQRQPGRPAGQQDRREVFSDKAREQTVYRQRDDDVSASSVFSYGTREIVHGGAAGVTYPAIVPLLRDFMQKKLLGGDTAMRYFVAYERLEVPHIERAFPSGTDGVWIWKDPDQSVHVKPTCSTLDPALKNRNLSLLSVAVGRLSDDDGSFYFDEPVPGSGNRTSTPDRQNRSNDRHPREAPTGAANEYGKRRDNYGGGKAPAGASPANGYGKRRDNYGGGKVPVGAGNERVGRRDAFAPEASTEASTQQQGQDRYRALLKRARDGNGKGFQRLF